jgi:hypothetical protein
MTETFLAEGAGVPGGRRLRIVSDCEDESAELGVLLADSRLALGLAAFELTARRGAGGAGVDRFRGLDKLTTGRGSVGEQSRQWTVCVERS